MPATKNRVSNGRALQLGRARFESLLRSVLPSAANAAVDVFDSCLNALHATSFTPPNTIFAEGAAPADMFSAMHDKVALTLTPSVLSVVFRTVAVALLGGVAALLLAELLQISLVVAGLIVAVIALIWWAGGVRTLLGYLATVFQEQVMAPLKSFGG